MKNVKTLKGLKREADGAQRETVETVPCSAAAQHTSLKRGVNETVHRIHGAGHSPVAAQPRLPITDYRSPITTSGFTMIEIAISLAVIGFALVAIIGILPQGMTVQKENRQETIINQDASMFLEAIRNGGKGFDDLTNYVVAITNYWTIYSDAATIDSGGIDSYTYTSAFHNGIKTGSEITNGLRIIGLLSTPRYINGSSAKARFQSNYIVAYVRSMSGQAGEKFPQTNSIMQDLAFGYRLMPEIAPYSYYEPDWTNFAAYSSPADWVPRSNYWRIASTMQTNLCDLRLTFRWPAFPNGKVGNDRQIFRTVAGGHLLRTNNLGMPVYFFEPRTYVKANLP